MDKSTLIKIIAGTVMFTVFLVLFVYYKGKIKISTASKGQKRLKKLFFIGILISAWFTVGALLTWISQRKSVIEIDFQMFSTRREIFGITIAETTIVGCGVTLILIVLALLFRFIAVPKFTDKTPGSFQNVCETVVEFLDKFVSGSVDSIAAGFLSPYMLSIALFMFGAAMSELFGLRAPTSDLTCTFALGLCTFALLNFYGLKKHGFAGRLKSMGGAVPMARPLMIPLKAVSDVAVPISLACRLFGNMMGGLLVMDLLKGVLGGYASGLPGIAGIYFNLIHPALQIYIFITLSLTFINEAME